MVAVHGFGGLVRVHLGLVRSGCSSPRVRVCVCVACVTGSQSRFVVKEQLTSETFTLCRFVMISILRVLGVDMVK